MADRLTRRGFIRLAGVTSTGMLLAACSSSAPAQPTTAPAKPAQPASSPAAAASPGTAAQSAPAGSASASNNQAAWNAVLAEAKKEGKVVIYGSVVSGADQLKKAFRDRYNVDLEFVVGRGNETIQKLLTERRAGLYLEIGRAHV